LINNNKTTKCHVSTCHLACPPCQRHGALSVARFVIKPPPVAVVVLPSLLSLPTASLHYYNALRKPATLTQGRLQCQSLLCHNLLILRCVHHLSGATRLSSSSLVVIVLLSAPPPDFCCCLLPLLIVKCPPLGSILVSLNSNDVGKDVGCVIFLEIVIGIALPIKDGLCCHPQESTPQTLSTTLVAMLPPLVGACAVLNYCIAFVVVIVVANVEVLLMLPPLPPQSLSLCRAPRGDEQKTMPLLSSSMYEDDESSASEGGMILQ
jgi:hypothetical protein